MTDVTSIGLGLMGSALARAMLAAGHGTTVWNRSVEKAAPLAERGALVAPTPGMAFAASPVIVICIDNYRSIQALLETDAIAPLLAGRVLVNLTTGTPREAEALAAWVSAQGALYLDGAILCGPGQIGTSGGEVLLSGDAAAWARAQPLLACLAGKVRLAGPGVGDASALDFAWLTMTFARFIGVTHAALICRAQGIDLHAFIDLFSPESDGYTRRLAGIIRNDDYNHPTATLEVWGEALARIQAQARDAGISPDIPDFIAGYFRKARDLGLGQEEAIAIFKTQLTPDQ
jgi:3-hydroxyisobutyrate dehydrogenase-like beta-hydroxyacid dehydrogenase